MEPETDWIRNTRPVRLAILGIVLLVVVGSSGLWLVVPAIGAPSGITWLGEAAIMIFGIGFVFRLQPTKVAIANDSLHVHWLVGGRRIPFAAMAKALFKVDGRYLKLDWARRYYTLHVFLVNGRRTVVGGLDGPVAMELMRHLPASKCKLQVYDGTRLIEERDVTGTSSL